MAASAAEVKNGDQHSVRGDDFGDPLVAGGEVGDVKNDYSPKPRRERSRRARSEYSPREDASQKVIDFAAFKASVTIHSSAFFDAKRWKRSRIKKGYLIARIKGYDPVESEYGVNYLKVIKRNPKRTSGDYSLYEHAGFFTWGALQASGRFVKERKRYERISGDGAGAS